MMINEMTNEQLDRWIAKKRGWEKCRCPECIKYHYNIWVNTIIPDNIEDAPKYTTDPRYAFELLDEMPTSKRMQAVSVPPWNMKRTIAEKWAEWRGGE